MLPNLEYPIARQPPCPCRFRFLPSTLPASPYSRLPGSPEASAAWWTGNAPGSATPPARPRRNRLKSLFPACAAVPRESGAHSPHAKAPRQPRHSPALGLPSAFLSLPVSLLDSPPRKLLALPRFSLTSPENAANTSFAWKRKRWSAAEEPGPDNSSARIARVSTARIRDPPESLLARSRRSPSRLQE